MLRGGINDLQQLFAADRTGVTVTAGASANTMGSWAQVASAANMSAPGAQIVLCISAGNASGVQRSFLVDIGVDPAGGTSYTTVVSGISASQAAARSAGGIWYAFPIRIPAGATVALRCQSTQTSVTLLATTYIYGQPTRPQDVRAGEYSEAIGVAAATSTGTSFTPVSGSKGSWTSLGTTSKSLWWWQVSFGLANATTTANTYFVDLAYGDGTNMTMMVQDSQWALPGAAEVVHHPLDIQCFCEVPAGSTIYVRSAATTTISTGAYAIAVGIGG